MNRFASPFQSPWLIYSLSQNSDRKLLDVTVGSDWVVSCQFSICCTICRLNFVYRWQITAGLKSSFKDHNPHGRIQPITSALAQLHWLLLRSCIDYKVPPMAYKALPNVRLSYLSELLTARALSCSPGSCYPGLATPMSWGVYRTLQWSLDFVSQEIQETYHNCPGSCRIVNNIAKH